MTEAEWLACDDPRAMDEYIYRRQTGREGGLLGHLQDGGPKLVPRKWRLTACAFCRRFSGQTDWDYLRPRVELTEQLADTSPPTPAVIRAATRVSEAAYAIFTTLEATIPAAGTWTEAEVEQVEEEYWLLRRSWCELLRDVFGNPFRPVVADPSWLTSTVVSLAEGIYSERAFDRLPILADALQDAGCDNADVLAHCRGSGPHARGCWVVDLLLGKS